MNKFLLTLTVLTAWATVIAQHEGFTFHTFKHLRMDSGGEIEEEHVFHLSSTDKLFIHFDKSNIDTPITQCYRVLTFKAINVLKHEWHAFFTVDSSVTGKTYDGKLIVTKDSQTLTIGTAIFDGTYSAIVPFVEEEEE